MMRFSSVGVASAAARISWPAIAALALGLGCGILALAQTVAIPSFTWQIWGAWILVLAFCMSNRVVTERACVAASAGDKRGAARRLWAMFQWAAWFFALTFSLAPPLSVMAGFNFLVPPDVVADDNLKVAVFIGWVSIGITLLAGASTGSTIPTLSPQGRSALAGEAPVPLSVPLLPTLSLFGLLNIVSVDTPVMIAFFTFAAAALYLVSYENHLHQALDARATATSRTPVRETGASTRGRANRPAAVQYIAICAVWMATFGLAAAAFYYPLTTALPRTSLALNINRGHERNRRLETDDWRSPGRSFSLRGGTYTLSEEEIARVSSEIMAPTDLWRGRIYEKYQSGADSVDSGAEEASRWEVAVPANNNFTLVEKAGTGWVDVLALHNGLLRRLNLHNMADAKDMNYIDIASRVQNVAGDVGGMSEALLSPGQPTQVRATVESLAVRTDGSARLLRRRQRDNTYRVRSRVPQPNMSQLNSARGLSAAQLKAWRARRAMALSLEVPRNRATQQAFQSIAAQIVQREKAAGRRMQTPYERTSAIARYLVDTCEYSLNVPTIPPTQDAALFFLTDSKRGACDMFASAMTLLLRTMNVPARLATGYRQPDMPDATGNTYTLRGKDAHAWVEYYVPSIGWLSYDPTEGTRRADESLGARVGELLHLPAQWKNRIVPVTVAVLISLFFGGAILMFLAWRRAAPQRGAMDADEAARARIQAAYSQARQLLAPRIAALDNTASHSLTPREFEKLVFSQPLQSDAKNEFAALTYLFDLASYAPQFPLETADQTRLQSSLSRLKAALKQKK